MRAFLTGIDGFVGRHLSNHLESHGDDWRPSDRKATLFHLAAVHVGYGDLSGAIDCYDRFLYFDDDGVDPRRGQAMREVIRLRGVRDRAKTRRTGDHFAIVRRRVIKLAALDSTPPFAAA